MNDKIIRTIALGVSAMVGFAVTETVYNISANWIRKAQERNVIEMVETPETPEKLES